MEVEEEKKRRNIPAWAWVLGCLAIVVACAVVVALGAAAVSIWAINSSQDDIAPMVANAEPVVEPTVVEPAADEPAADEPAADEPAADEPATDEPEVIDPTTNEATGQPTAPDESTPATGEPDAPAGSPGEASPSPVPPPAVEDPHAADRAAIEANVVAIRELEPKAAVMPKSLTQDELRQRLEEDLFEDYDPEQARQDAIVMSAFDFMPADFELHGFILDLLTEQIAGFYDPETDEFVIVGDDEAFSTLEQVAYAHEYVHALQDQYYDLELLDDDELESEAAFAVQALAEGEATFVQTQFMIGGYFDAGQLLELVEESLTVDTTILDSAPPVIARELEFPYLTGLEFVQALYAQGGYDAVDAAWKNLPQTTEHILHPQRYLDGDAPQLVSLAPLTGTLGAGWELVDEDTLGEFYLREFLAQQLAADDVDQAATGWGGDRYAVYWKESLRAPVMVLKSVWDTPADAQEFSEQFPQYPEGLFGSASESAVEGGRCWSGSDVICLFSTGDETLVVRAPDLETVARVAAAQRPGG